MSEIAKTLIVIGVIFIFVGFGVMAMGRIPGFGKLPGDILIKKENYTIYIPLTTCIIISIILSLVFYLWNQR